MADVDTPITADQWMWLAQRDMLCQECSKRITAQPLRPKDICLCCLGTHIPPVPWSELT